MTPPPQAEGSDTFTEYEFSLGHTFRRSRNQDQDGGEEMVEKEEEEDWVDEDWIEESYLTTRSRGVLDDLVLMLTRERA